MELEKFGIDTERMDSAIVELLILISARQKALQEYILLEKSVTTGEDLNELKKIFNDRVSFYFKESFQQLYESYGSIKEVLQEQNEP